MPFGFQMYNTFDLLLELRTKMLVFKKVVICLIEKIRYR